MASAGPPDPYKSARDLPSVVELLKQLKGMKTLTRLIARSQRELVKAIERQLNDLVATIDGFYERLGSRHWIFHESLNTEVAKSVIAYPSDAEAEQALIAHYQDTEALGFMITRLRRFPQLRARMPQIERAREDYEAGRFDSATLLLLTVTDGFVNDIETAQRRGLHARSDDEMSAWNSVVGHHMGLSRAHRTFTKGFSKTSDDEVHELYRNGIVHGMLTNYNNPIVATKAWNRLFAVADWAQSREKQTIPPEPERSWGEVIGQVTENARVKKALDGWKPRTLIPEDADFENEPILALAAEVLDAWKGKNYGRMATPLASLTREDTPGKSAGRLRDEYALAELEDFRIIRLDFEAPIICEVDAELTIGGETKVGRMRWIKEHDDGEPALPGQEESGQWRFMTWGPFALFNRADPAEAA